jgi:hypothetical protein
MHTWMKWLEITINLNDGRLTNRDTTRQPLNG